MLSRTGWIAAARPSGHRNVQWWSASRYWIARYEHARNVNARPSQASAPDASVSLKTMSSKSSPATV
jgi:hypothetical protein